MQHPTEVGGHMTLRQSLTDLRVVVLAFTYLTGLIGLNGVYYWMPQIVKSFGLGNATVGLVTAIPHFFGAVAMIIWARSSDRSGKRVWHVAAACLLGAVAMAASSLAPNSLLVMIGLTVALVGAYGFLATFGRCRPHFSPAARPPVGLA